MCPLVKPWNPSRASPGPRSPRPGAQLGQPCALGAPDLVPSQREAFVRGTFGVCLGITGQESLCCAFWAGLCHLLGSHPRTRG